MERSMPGVLMSNPRNVRRALAALGGTLLVGAFGASGVSAAPQDDLRVAVDAVRGKPHYGVVTFTVNSVTRGDPDVPDSEQKPSIDTYTLTQRVSGLGRSEGVIGNTRSLPGAPDLQDQAMHVVRYDGLAFARTRRFGLRPLQVRAQDLGALWELTDPASELRFPKIEHIEGLASLPNAGTRSQLQGELTEVSARTILRRLFATGPPEDVKVGGRLVAAATFDERSLSAHLDASRLTRSELLLRFVTPRSAISPQLRGELVVRITATYDVSPKAVRVTVKRPANATPFGDIVRATRADAAAGKLLDAASSALDRAYATLNTYQASIRRLRAFDPDVRFRVRPTAVAARHEVQLVSLATRAFVIRTRSATGKTYTLTKTRLGGTRARSTRTCQLPSGGRCAVR